MDLFKVSLYMPIDNHLLITYSPKHQPGKEAKPFLYNFWTYNYNKVTMESLVRTSQLSCYGAAHTLPCWSTHPNSPWPFIQLRPTTSFKTFCDQVKYLWPLSYNFRYEKNFASFSSNISLYKRKRNWRQILLKNKKREAWTLKFDDIVGWIASHERIHLTS